jgi:uncharacterized membrane protein
MNANDIDRIHAAGLISDDQRQAIFTHFRLGDSPNRLLLILSVIGGIMVAAGLILVMAANWDRIPELVKISAGLALMVGCHLGGWWLRRAGRFHAAAEGLNLIGSLLFLGNIALLGQVFNLGSRPQNAILLWLAGIAPTALLLRSKPQHILTLLAATVWLGYETFHREGWFHVTGGEQGGWPILLLGANAFIALGVWLKRGAFGPTTEKHGLLLAHLVTLPLTWPFFLANTTLQSGDLLIALVVSLAVGGLLLLGVWRNQTVLTAQWRVTWAATLLGVLLLGWLALLYGDRWDTYRHEVHPVSWAASIGLFVFCLLQVQVGLLRQSPWLVNLAIVFIAAHLITAYVKLFGTMLTTGTVFIVGGVFLVALAIYLERKRRQLLAQINTTTASPQP